MLFCYDQYGPLSKISFNQSSKCYYIDSIPYAIHIISSLRYDTVCLWIDYIRTKIFTLAADNLSHYVANISFY